MAARVRLGQALMAVGVVAFGVVIVVFGDLGLLWESKAAARHAALTATIMPSCRTAHVGDSSASRTSWTVRAWSSSPVTGPRRTARAGGGAGPCGRGPAR